jgi:predicted N-acetyltransferase YhbS
MNDIQIENLSGHRDLIPLLAQWHYRQWGDLTGASSEKDYQKLLCRYTSPQIIPLTLLAVNGNRLLGSVNVVQSDLDIRPELTPWLAQLYVPPEERDRGIGSTLVRAAAARSKELGFDTLYLYTSGTLPIFYERIGWTMREIVRYKGKERTIMAMKLTVNK